MLRVEEEAAFKVPLPHILLGQANLPFLVPMLTRPGHPQGTELGPGT